MKNVSDILSGPWAIEPTRLMEMRAIYDARMRGGQLDVAAVEEQLGRKLQNQPVAYEIQNGVAVLPIDGVLAKRMNMFTQISGGTSMELAGKALQAASADPAAHSVVLLIDSPGGTVDGTETLSGQVLASRASGKPVVALASGAMNSAAYWIGSAAQAVYLAEPSTVMGSIGVVAQHVDVSGAQQKSGVTTTEIYAGQYKRIASQYAPLSDAGRVSIQNQVDFMYSIFVDAVARNRGVSSTEVLSNMADGRLFIGQQAIDAGLADGITSLADLVASLNVQHQSGQKGIPMRQIATQQARQPMTRADLHEAAKAYQLQHPGTDYLTAVKACDTQGLVSSMQSGGDAISQSYQPERVALHEAAKAYQLQHPGTDYLAAVRACEAVTAGR